MIPTLPDGVLQATKFLAVDDELSNIRILEKMFAKWECFNVMTTTKSTEALPLFLEYQPDIVLLDLSMPELTGFDVMKQLKPHIAPETFLPIVILTADLTRQTKRKALAAGAKDFLTKPFDSVELSLRIFNLVETRYYYQELQKRLLQEK